MMYFSWTLLTFFILSTAQANVFSGNYRGICEQSVPEGCPCYSSEGRAFSISALFFRSEILTSATGTDDSALPWISIKKNDITCFVPRTSVKAIYYESFTCPEANEYATLPFLSLSSNLFAGSLETTPTPIGTLFPTFYNIAQERYFTGDKTLNLIEHGTHKIIKKVSPEFKAAINMEGTGLLDDGRVVNVGTIQGSRIIDYVILPPKAYGTGVQGHRLYPYRSAAVDFRYLCKQLGIENCEKASAKLAGLVLYIPRLKGTLLPDGSVHDGFICASDVGGAIKDDRIDLFVGPMGGEDPMVPECQRPNAYSAAGISSLIPTDWTVTPIERTQYRQTAAHKALEVYAVKDTYCKPEMQ